jgi:DNA processing protein
MAGGANVIYPRANTDLHQRICEYGAIVSEMPPGIEPLARHFPRRNRVISGASHGVVVVEGTLKSGSLITARLALDQGWDVFAVPRSTLTLRAQGPNSLIREVAVLVRSTDDVLLELGEPGQFIDTSESANLTTTQSIDNKEGIEPSAIKQMILEQIDPPPVTVDELRRQCQVSAPF